MTVPTKIIDKDQFMELAKAEGDTLIVHRLTNVPFDPPTPEGMNKPKHKRIGMNILLMNVTEPVIYKDTAAKQAFVIINGYNQDETFTYENFQDIHLLKNAWGYCLAPSYWDPTDWEYGHQNSLIGDDLEDAVYCFKHETREGQGLDKV